MAMRVPPGGSSLGSFLFTTSAPAFGRPRSQIVNGSAPDASSGLDIDFTTGTLDSRITFARGSTATYINASGLVASAASGAPRFDYDPISHLPRGLLLEEQRTNRINQSGDVGWAGGGWSLGAGSITQWVTTAPDGGPTGNLLTATATGSASYVYQYPAGLTAAPHTASCFVKKGTAPFFLIRAFEDSAAAWLDLTTGLVGTVTNCAATVEDVGNGWLRFALTRTLTNTTLAFTFGQADADNVLTSTIGTTIYLWGAQVEAGGAASSYIPTTTVAVTRAADTAEMTGANFSSWYNAAAGTFIAEYRPQSVGGTQPVISVNDTTANEAINLYGSGADPKATVIDGGATQADLDAGTLAANIFCKFGFAFTLNDFAACLDAGTVATDVVGTLPTVTQLQFHTDIAGNAANLHIRGLDFYPVRKSDSELQGLTLPTIIGTGTLAAPVAVTTGTGSATTLPAVGSGTPAALAAVVTNTGGVSSSISAAPALAAQSAVVASVTGISRSLITDTTLVADAAVVASTTGISRSLITDTALDAGVAAVVSTTGVSRSLITDTTIDAGVAAVASTTGLVRSINTANALAAQAAVVASTTGLSRSIAPSSALVPQRSTVVGIGGGAIITGAGVLNVLPAAAAGTGLAVVTGTGTLQAVAANSNGLGLSQFVGTGALFAEWADIAGLGSIPYSPFVSGPYTQVGDLWEGAAVWGKIDGKWRRMRLWSRSAAAWGMVAWDKDAQEVDVISEPAYGALAARGAHIAGSGFIRDQIWGAGDLRAGPAFVTDSSSLSGLSVITNAAWEATPVWLKVDGKWRRATMWTNVSEEWKRVA